MTEADVIIIGGGPAGLNAAIVLGRSRRKVIVFDTGKQRNLRSHGLHNYLTRDDILPPDFLQIAKKEIKKYGVTSKNTAVIAVEKTKSNGFKVTDSKNSEYHARKILLATGVRDRLPAIEGFDALYGQSVFHCPYCDGWEVRDKKIGVYARNRNGFDLAMSISSWSKSVTFFTDGRNYLKDEERRVLKQYGIPVIPDRIARLQGKAGKLNYVEFKNGEKLPCDALFFVNGYEQQSELAEKLGCLINTKKVVVTNRYQQTNVPGVYVAGDASRDMHFVVVAAAEGAKAGVSINKELQLEEKNRRIRPAATLLSTE